jgi:glycine cleavage system H lipoate-binding protein
VMVDVYSPVTGTVNTSNTASALLRGLERINASPLSKIPVVGSATKYAEESLQQKALKKMVEESLKYQP